MQNFSSLLFTIRARHLRNVLRRRVEQAPKFLTFDLRVASGLTRVRCAHGGPPIYATASNG